MVLSVSVPDVSVVALATVEDMRARIRRKSKLKGRQADDDAIGEVRALVGLAPHRRDLLQLANQVDDGEGGSASVPLILCQFADRFRFCRERGPLVRRVLLDLQGTSKD